MENTRDSLLQEVLDGLDKSLITRVVVVHGSGVQSIMGVEDISLVLSADGKTFTVDVTYSEEAKHKLWREMSKWSASSDRVLAPTRLLLPSTLEKVFLNEKDGDTSEVESREFLLRGQFESWLMLQDNARTLKIFL